MKRVKVSKWVGTTLLLTVLATVLLTNNYLTYSPIIRWCHLSTIPGTTPHCLVNKEGDVNLLGARSLV